MDGVRRWIGASPHAAARVGNKTSKVHMAPDGAGHRHKGALKTGQQADNKAGGPSEAQIAIETVVARLMSPTVSEDEEAEYRW